jgi:hypothetical protein
MSIIYQPIPESLREGYNALATWEFMQGRLLGPDQVLARDAAVKSAGWTIQYLNMSENICSPLVEYPDCKTAFGAIIASIEEQQTGEFGVMEINTSGELSHMGAALIFFLLVQPGIGFLIVGNVPPAVVH